MITRLKKILLSCLLILISAAVMNCDRNPSSGTEDFDIVILNGRVIDPESKLDAIRNVGIKEGSVIMITEKPIKGKTTIDARGLVVAPGFIDMHQHGQDRENYTYKVLDGVTTALELEMGTADVDRWYSEREGNAFVNFGVSVGHVPLRMEIMHDPGGFAPVADAVYRSASDSEIGMLKNGIEHGLNRGALGVGFGLMYTPAASRWEILEIFRIAGRTKAPCFVHMRYAGLKEPNSCIAALEEIISASAITGGSASCCAYNKSGIQLYSTNASDDQRGSIPGLLILQLNVILIRRRKQLSNLLFMMKDGRNHLEYTYSDLQWAATGERLTAESFAQYRKTGGMVIAHSISEDIVKSTIADSIVIIASDGMLSGGKGHPRGTGTFARVLGKYVREEKLISLARDCVK